MSVMRIDHAEDLRAPGLELVLEQDRIISALGDDDERGRRRAGDPRARSLPAWRRAGVMLKRKVEPAARTLETVISPPINSTRRLLMVRPRPVPPCLRVAEASPCWKGWKSSGSASGEMPMPVSLMRNSSR